MNDILAWPTAFCTGTSSLIHVPYNGIVSAGDSTCGQRALYQLGLTGIPIYNVRLFVAMNIEHEWLHSKNQLSTVNIWL